ncbi:MAG TPA: prephenate dehydratase [Parvularcula sp.]|nr:prephenate dehydratase [Parvularcula sp.]HBS35022.1 prephenate dehydratase [Parvularcula sp.]
MVKASSRAGKVVFQGEPGAYSHLACEMFAPAFEPVPCPTFEEALAAVREGRADRAMLPVENSLAGRVADIHHLLPESDLNIVGEHFFAIRHQLLGLKGAKLSDIRVVKSHAMALGQVRALLARPGIRAEIAGDTAGAARALAESGKRHEAVIASSKAAELYGLDILEADVEDAGHNTTRFLVMSREPVDPPRGGPIVTTFVFQVRNIPAALYKALGGFATNGVNMTKLESYMQGGSFAATLFYADIEGHPDDANVRLALEELSFFSSRFKLLGVYPAARAR